MKKWLVCFLIGLLAVTGCGNEAEIDVQPSQEKIEVENKAEDGQADIDTAEKLPEVNSIQLYKDYIAYEEWGDVSVVCSSKRDVLKIIGEELETYPRLNNALETIGAEAAEQMSLFMADNTEYAMEEEENEYFNGYKDDSKMYVQRADDVIVSVKENAYQYTGGAHPMYAMSGLNIDPVTGEQLFITDVVTDFSKLVNVLNDKLIEKYGEETFYSVPEELLCEYTPEQFSWTMGYQGITFYFSPYELAPYAAGTQVVTLWFNEAEEWIDKKYMAAPVGGYVAELPMNEEVHVDLNVEDSKEDVLTIGRNFVEEEVFQLSVSINDETYCSEETFYYGEMDVSLACIPYGEKDRFYLYVKFTIETTDLYIYELTKDGIKFQGSLENVRMPGVVLEQWDAYNQTQAYMEQILTNPSEFTMISRMYLMGFMDGTKTYSADSEDGIPKSSADYYELPEDFAVLTSKRALEVEILPEKKIETVKEDTEFVYLRTDNKTYIDFRMDDGRECRVHFEEDSWGKTINGNLPEECFEGIPMYF